MANVLANIARVESLTTGTGTLTLGTAIAGFNSFANAGITNGQTVTYAIEDYNAAGTAVTQREVGSGVYTTAGLTLTRNVYSSTNAGAAISCSGRQHVFITAAKEDFDTFLTTAAAAGAYQPLDADLTTLAANITTFGHSLVDDADNTAARTTLGLGTAAVQNTGTSGATLPFLNGTNTWSAINTFSSGQIFGAASTMATGELNVVSPDAGAGFGPLVRYVRDSASPAASDGLGGFQFLGRNDAASAVTYADILAQAIAVTAGSTQGHMRFRTDTNGSAVNRLILQLGAQVGAPTGGDQGVGTLNAVTLYENGTSLALKYGSLTSANVWTAAATYRIDDAGTNSVTTAATLSHTTSGTPATGIGVGLNFEAETSAGNNEIGAAIQAITTDVTSTSEDFDIVFKAMAAGAAAAEVARMLSTGVFVAASEIRASGDVGGAASKVTLTNTNDLSANNIGVGTILMKGTTSRNTSGFIKIYIGTTAYYVPAFSAITG